MPRKKQGPNGQSVKAMPEYFVYKQMWYRCYVPTHKSYADYGGRGIVVSAEWDTFDKFYADLGQRPGPAFELDRRNNDGPYSPANCRWVTKFEQMRNRRNTKPYTFRGQTHIL